MNTTLKKKPDAKIGKTIKLSDLMALQEYRTEIDPHTGKSKNVLLTLNELLRKYSHTVDSSLFEVLDKDGLGVDADSEVIMMSQGEHNDRITVTKTDTGQNHFKIPKNAEIIFAKDGKQKIINAEGKAILETQHNGKIDQFPAGSRIEYMKNGDVKVKLGNKDPMEPGFVRFDLKTKEILEGDAVVIDHRKQDKQKPKHMDAAIQAAGPLAKRCTEHKANSPSSGALLRPMQTPQARTPKQKPSDSPHL